MPASSPPTEALRAVGGGVGVAVQLELPNMELATAAALPPTGGSRFVVRIHLGTVAPLVEHTLLLREVGAMQALPVEE
jgi:hypothetical protein